MTELISPNARKWLNTISYAEGTWDESKGAPTYDVTFGYQKINDLSGHPRRVVNSGGHSSAAAGAYQFMPSTWDGVQRSLGLPNFGPEAQDIAALNLIRARGVDPDTAPIDRENLSKLSPEWASLPTKNEVSYYPNQTAKPSNALIKFASTFSGPAASEKSSTQLFRSQSTSAQQPQSTSAQQPDIRKYFMPDPTGPVTETSVDQNEKADFSYEDKLFDLFLQEAKNKQEQEKKLEEENNRLINQANASKQAAALLVQEAMSSFATPKSVI
jgi:lysozyme